MGSLLFTVFDDCGEDSRQFMWSLFEKSYGIKVGSSLRKIVGAGYYVKEASTVHTLIFSPSRESPFAVAWRCIKANVCETPALYNSS